MRTSYQVEVYCNNKKIDCDSFKVDPNDFNNMLLLVDYLTTILFDLQEEEELRLRVFSDSHTLFNTLVEFDYYKEKNKIEAHQDSEGISFLTVNRIQYKGEIEAGMIA